MTFPEFCKCELVKFLTVSLWRRGKNWKFCTCSLLRLNGIQQIHEVTWGQKVRGWLVKLSKCSDLKSHNCLFKKVLFFKELPGDLNRLVKGESHIGGLGSCHCFWERLYLQRFWCMRCFRVVQVTMIMLAEMVSYCIIIGF